VPELQTGAWYAWSTSFLAGESRCDAAEQGAEHARAEALRYDSNDPVRLLAEAAEGIARAVACVTAPLESRKPLAPQYISLARVLMLSIPVDPGLLRGQLRRASR
jgi:hypothetical protein